MGTSNIAVSWRFKGGSQTTLSFFSDIREIQKDDTLGKMWQVIPLWVNDFLRKIQGYVWYQDDISLAEHRLAGPFKFGTTGRKKLKYPNMIVDKQCK